MPRNSVEMGKSAGETAFAPSEKRPRSARSASPAPSKRAKKTEGGAKQAPKSLHATALDAPNTRTKETEGGPRPAPSSASLPATAHSASGAPDKQAEKGDARPALNEPPCWAASRAAFGDLVARWRGECSMQPFLDSLPKTERAAQRMRLQSSVEEDHRRRHNAPEGSRAGMVPPSMSRFLPTRGMVDTSVNAMARFLSKLTAAELREVASCAHVGGARTKAELAGSTLLRERVLLPWLVYAEDTVYTYRIMHWWRGVADLPSPVTAGAISDQLGALACVACAIVASGAALRRALAPAWLEVLAGGPARLGAAGQLAARSMWVEPPSFSASKWCFQTKPTSFSLEFSGALDVLDMHSCAVAPGEKWPLLMLMPRAELLKV